MGFKKSLVSFPNSFWWLLLTGAFIIFLMIDEKYSIFLIFTVAPILRFLILVITFISFVILSVLTLVTVLRNKRARSVRIITFIVAILLIFLLARHFKSDLNKGYLEKFESNIYEFETVASMVVESKLTNCYVDTSFGIKYIKLPLKYRYLSKGGEVWMEEKDGTASIFFIYSSDILYEHFSGYIYRSNNKELTDTDFDGSFVGAERVKKNWFLEKQ